LQRCHLFDICSRTVPAYAKQVWLHATGRSLQDGLATEDFQAFYELPWHLSDFHGPYQARWKDPFAALRTSLHEWGWEWASPTSFRIHMGVELACPPAHWLSWPGWPSKLACLGWCRGGSFKGFARMGSRLLGHPLILQGAHATFPRNRNVCCWVLERHVPDKGTRVQVQTSAKGQDPWLR
jgi:hypothetical protein